MRILIALTMLSLPLACTQAKVSETSVGLAVADTMEIVDARPNILWIVAEDVSPWFSAYGDNTVNTPALDAMSNDGVTFLNAFANVPICSPVRSSLMTGRWAVSTGVHNHRRSRDTKGRDAIYLEEGTETLPEIFMRNGYATFNIGKDDYNFVYDRRDLYSEGPDEVAGHIGDKNGPDFAWEELAKGKPFFGQIQLRGGKSRGKKVNIELDSTEIEMPPYYPDTSNFRRRWEDHYKSIADTDAEVAEIFAKLEATGEADNTAVFFISDHGMPMLRHKQFLYDGGTHVPVMVTYPNGKDEILKHGSRREELISTIDLSAASLDLADISIPDYFDGRSLFGDNIERRKFVPMSRDRGDFTFDQIRAVRTDKFKYIRNKYPNIPYNQSSYRDGWPVTKEYVQLNKDGKLTPEQALFMAEVRPAEELYDLENDPHEVKNLAGHPEYADTLSNLSSLLDSWIIESGDKGQIEENEIEIAAVVARWGSKCVDKRCVDYRTKYGEEEPAGAVGVIKDGK